jgi:N utilization substance protein B
MRELVFKYIYGKEIQGEDSEDQLDLFIESNDITDEEVINYLKTISTGINEHKDEIDELIKTNLKQNWSLNRISKINLSLIKIAIFEMLYMNLPYKVAINEVVELAKKYADDSAPVFINGILASIVKEKKLDSQDNK